ncbi:MAG: glycosyltransferase family 39 protein [Bacteroidales bacterium]|nr:glycosyltransferase family 39 protein [Bacteroidales bacterium]
MKALAIIKQNYWLFAILILGSILRFYHIDYQSVWLDEIHTLNEANPNLTWSEFYASLLASDPHPPLYFALIRVLFFVFGYQTLVLRLFSAFLGVLGIYAIYRLGKEIENKTIGLIAAFLLVINYFHLYYSQDGRPYILLILFTILAFYRLVIFIKTPYLRNAIWYGIFAALMIYGHLFGLVVLFAQYIILLFFFLITEKQKRITFFKNVFISGVITAVLYIPALGLLIKSMNITDFWIPAPTSDAYLLIFNEFFGNSELIIALVVVLFLYYFMNLTKEKNTVINYNSIVNNKTVFNFIIFITWIVIVLLIPLIRSYLSTPMLISRYFIVVLPAILFIISIGIVQLKNKAIRIVILALFLVFSMTDIFVIKKYYHNINKAQFRESTDFIKQNNLNDEPVVSSLSWYLPYFLKNKVANYNIINQNLDDYFAAMEEDSTLIKPFWYFDAFGREYKLAENNQHFLNTHFYIENNYDGFQAWTKHFILLKGVAKTIDLTKFAPLKQYNGDPFMFNIETFEQKDGEIYLSGWAYFEKQEATNTIIEITLIKDKELLGRRFQIQKVIRKDVTTYFKSDFDLSNAGFSANYKSELKSGKYVVALYLKNEETKKEGLILTDKIIDVKE